MRTVVAWLDPRPSGEFYWNCIECWRGWTQCRCDLRDDRKSWEKPGMASDLLLWVLSPCFWASCHYHFRFGALTEMQDFLKGRNVFVKFPWVLLIKDILFFWALCSKDSKKLCSCDPMTTGFFFFPPYSWSHWFLVITVTFI